MTDELNRLLLVRSGGRQCTRHFPVLFHHKVIQIGGLTPLALSQDDDVLNAGIRNREVVGVPT